MFLSSETTQVGPKLRALQKHRAESQSWPHCFGKTNCQAGREKTKPSVCSSAHLRFRLAGGGIGAKTSKLGHQVCTNCNGLVGNGNAAASSTNNARLTKRLLLHYVSHNCIGYVRFHIIRVCEYKNYRRILQSKSSFLHSSYRGRSST